MDIKDAVTNLLNTKAKKITVIVIAAIILVLIIGLITLGTMGRPMDPNNTETVKVKIEAGSGTIQIAQTLVENNIIDNPTSFRIWSKLKGHDGNYKAGTYSLSQSMSFSDIAEIIVGGKVDATVFGIPEGYTIYQVADKLSKDGLVDKEKFIDLLENGDFSSEYEFLKGAQNNKNRLEGYLYPNTYFVDEDASEEAFIKVMLDQFGKEVTEEHYQKAKDMGLTMNEVITIASIIQRECDVSKEGDKVASVIYNRLELGMPLQMCSTVQYILGEPKPVLSVADTRIESPYNTYLHTGLPPGPICSPNIDAIEAALNPADTDYLYFVLSEKLDGTSNFSNNYEKFKKDSENYSRAYDAANK